MRNKDVYVVKFPPALPLLELTTYATASFPVSKCLAISMSYTYKVSYLIRPFEPRGRDSTSKRK